MYLVELTQELRNTVDEVTLTNIASTVGTHIKLSKCKPFRSSNNTNTGMILSHLWPKKKFKNLTFKQIYEIS